MSVQNGVNRCPPHSDDSLRGTGRSNVRRAALRMLLYFARREECSHGAWRACPTTIPCLLPPPVTPWSRDSAAPRSPRAGQPTGDDFYSAAVARAGRVDQLFCKGPELLSPPCPPHPPRYTYHGPRVPQYYSSTTVWCSIDKCSREARERERFERDHTARILSQKKRKRERSARRYYAPSLLRRIYSPSSSLPCRGPLCVVVGVVAVAFAARFGVAATAPAAKPVHSTESTYRPARACFFPSHHIHLLVLRHLLLLILNEGRLPVCLFSLLAEAKGVGVGTEGITSPRSPPPPLSPRGLFSLRRQHACNRTAKTILRKGGTTTVTETGTA
ncbi:unnamed protein product, partial [Ectocarpus sp. 13 AM-2016]